MRPKASNHFYMRRPLHTKYKRGNIIYALSFQEFQFYEVRLDKIWILTKTHRHPQLKHTCPPKEICEFYKGVRIYRVERELFPGNYFALHPNLVAQPDGRRTPQNGFVPESSRKKSSDGNSIEN